ncbi:MAG: SCP2 sterol-binding domain-containing protein [Acidimicrobiales bacterium]
MRRRTAARLASRRKAPDLTGGIEPAERPGSPELVFASEAWLEALGRELSSAGPLPGESALRLGQLIAGAGGEVEAEWVLVLEGGSPPRLETGAGSTRRADVTLVEDASSAFELASGSATASDLLAAGRLKIRGDPRLLTANAEMIEAVARATTSLSRSCHILPMTAAR